MKTSQFLILLIIGVLLTAFITNPDRKKHSEKATEILFKVNQDDESYGILGGLLSSFAVKTVEGNLKIHDYYLFSKSYALSPSRNKKLDLGFGIFGKVIPLADSSDLKSYLKVDQPKKDVKETIRKQNVNRQTKSIIKKEEEQNSDSDTEAINSILNGPEGSSDQETENQNSNSYYGS